MPVDFESVEPPSDDKRWRAVEKTMRSHGFRADALIEALHTVQEFFGFLDVDSLRYVARSLRLPYSKVYGVATFYHYFTMKPQGEHTCVICTGTACYIKGAGAIVEAIGEAYGIKPGETTPDGKLSLLTARCVGACGLAPAVVLDGKMFGRTPPEGVLERIRRCVDES